MYLAGDIGGTKTVLALLRRRSGRLETVHEELFKSQEFSGFGLILNRFLKGRPKVKIKAACFGVAGPIRDGHCRTTNLPWTLDERKLARTFGIGTVRLLNDLQATAYGILFIPDRELAVLNKGSLLKPEGNIAVLAAGTGLGEALLCWDGRTYVPVASEGGHVEFGPQDDRETRLLGFLRSEYGHVSYERILSGPGLFNIYRFLRECRPSREPAWLREKLKVRDPSPVITQVGLARGHALCTEALEIFTSIYGAEAGNLALKGLALGGVYLGGGIAPKILKKLKEGTFMRAFLNKGRYAALMKEIPVKVVLNSQAALIGAAQYALRI